MFFIHLIAEVIYQYQNDVGQYIGITAKEKILRIYFYQSDTMVFLAPDRSYINGSEGVGCEC